MRIANVDGRLALRRPGGWLDVERASGGRLPSDPQQAYARWSELSRWAAGDPPGDLRPDADVILGPPVPFPAQIFAVGLNYRDHATESGLDLPEHPLVFTKFPSSVTGPTADIALSGEKVDWEVELVVVVGAGGRDISVADAWDAVAGLTVGQDISDREVQWRGSAAQFSLGKSFAGFAPIGPTVVSVDELRDVADPDALRVSTTVIGVDGTTTVVQDGTTAQLVFPVAELVSRLSAIVELRPGDLIFTGTPAGVGMGMDPPRYLRPGEVLVSEIQGLGQLRNPIV